MDLLFGTYTCPGHEPRAFGIKEPMWRSYLGQMLYPLLPRRKKDAPVTDPEYKEAAYR